MVSACRSLARDSRDIDAVVENLALHDVSKVEAWKERAIGQMIMLEMVRII